MWTNQTLNIWSHLIGFCFFSVCMVNECILNAPSYHEDTGSHVFFFLTLACYQICMLASVGYHTFHCQDERSCNWWFLRDVNGMVVAFAGSCLQVEYYLFYCDTFWKTFHITLTVCFLLATLCLTFNCPEKYNLSFYKRSTFQVLGFLSTCSISVAHFILRTGWSSEYVHFVIIRLAIGYLLLAVALTVYVMKIPESIFPGKMDYIGNSHLWWHLMIVGSEYYLYDFLKSLAIRSKDLCK